MKEDKELENIKRLKNSFEFLPDNKMKEIRIFEYNYYKQFLNNIGLLNNLDDYENTELFEKQIELLRKYNFIAYHSVFDNIDLISKITDKLIEVYRNYPLNIQIYNSKIRKPISNDDLLKIINDFFQSLGDDVYNLFNKMCQNNYIRLISNKDDLNYCGISYDVTSCFDYRIILIDPKNPNLLYHTLVHEMGHCYDFVRNKTNKTVSSINLFSEVPAIIFEKLFAYYLIENGYYKNYGLDNLLNWKQDVLAMNIVNSFVNKAYKNNYVLLNQYSAGELEINDDAYLDESQNTLDCLCIYDTKISNYDYVLSDIIANNLLAKYFIDKKKGLIEIKNFITTMYQYNVRDILEQFGLNLTSSEDELKMLYNYQKKKFHL